MKIHLRTAAQVAVLLPIALWALPARGAESGISFGVPELQASVVPGPGVVKPEQVKLDAGQAKVVLSGGWGAQVDASGSYPSATLQVPIVIQGADVSLAFGGQVLSSLAREGAGNRRFLAVLPLASSHVNDWTVDIVQVRGEKVPLRIHSDLRLKRDLIATSPSCKGASVDMRPVSSGEVHEILLLNCSSGPEGLKVGVKVLEGQPHWLVGQQVAHLSSDQSILSWQSAQSRGSFSFRTSAANLPTVKANQYRVAAGSTGSGGSLRILDFQLGGLMAYQASPSAWAGSGEVSWNPTWILPWFGRNLALRGSFGVSVIRASDLGSYDPFGEFSLLVSYLGFDPWLVSLGGGAQVQWNKTTETYFLPTLEVAYRPSRKVLGFVERFFVDYSPVNFRSSTWIHELKLGVGLSL